MANWLAGGSCFAPTMNGLNVPIELSLAIHSDAGVANDYSSIIGTLAISTTFHNDGIFIQDFHAQILKSLQECCLMM